MLSNFTRTTSFISRTAKQVIPATSIAVARASTTVQPPNFAKHPPTKYGGTYTVTLIPGDGIGNEIANAVKTVFKAINAPIDWEQFDVSGQTSHGDALFQASVESLKRNKVGLKGIIYTPIERGGHASWNVAMRKDLDIYASLSLIKNVPGYETRHVNVDLAIIRENTEGEYSGLEHQSYPGVVESLKVVTRAKTERIARFAFDFAIKNGRKKVTCVHKANIMKLADGLFLNTCRDIAKEYTSMGITFDDMIVDNTSMQLVSRPQQFDVLVMPNLYGNVTSNVGAALVGGPGIVPGGSIGREYAVFEPGCRHVGLDIQGKGKANPTALILSACMMLRHLGLDNHANLIANATYLAIKNGARTPDMKGILSTKEFTQSIIDHLDQ